MSEVSAARERIFAAGRGYQRQEKEKAAAAIIKAREEKLLRDIEEAAKVVLWERTHAEEARRLHKLRDFEAAYRLVKFRMGSRGTLARILTEVCEKHGFTPQEICSPRRGKLLVQARQECFWRARKETTLSYPQIARFFERDHTTVLHGVRVHEQRMAIGQ